jgi:hypothetical protein
LKRETTTTRGGDDEIPREKRIDAQGTDEGGRGITKG